MFFKSNLQKGHPEGKSFPLIPSIIQINSFGGPKFPHKSCCNSAPRDLQVPMIFKRSLFGLSYVHFIKQVARRGISP